MEEKDLTEEKPTKRKKKKSPLIRTLLLIGIVLGIAGGLFALLKFVFVYKGAVVSESEIYDENEIISSIGIEMNTPLFLVNREEIASRIAESFQYLKDIKVSISFPQKIKVDFTEEAGEIKMTLGNDTFAITKDLYVLKILKKSELDLVKRVEIKCGDLKKCIAGQNLEFYSATVDEAMHSTLQAIFDKDMFSDIQLIDVSDQFNIKIRYLDRFNVTLGESNDIIYKLELMKKASQELEKNIIAEIDVTDASRAYVRITSNTDI